MTTDSHTFTSHNALAAYSQRLKLGNNDIHVYDSKSHAGNLLPILLFHGLGDDADTWAHTFPVLVDKGYRVIAPDWPGSGRSTSKHRVTIGSLYGIISPLLSELRIERCHIAGHSMGAMISHLFSIENPDTIVSTTLIGGILGAAQGKISPSLLLSLLPGIGEIRYTRLRRDADAAFSSLEPYYANLTGIGKVDRDFLYTRVNQRVWSNSHRRAYFSLLRSLPAWLGTANAKVTTMENLNLPITVIFGEEDRIVSPTNAETAVQRMPKASFYLIPDAGHNVQQEQPEAVAAKILETISQALV